MALKIANNAVGNLAAPMTTGDTTLTLQSGQGARFPVLGAGDWHPVTVVKVDGSLEIMRATARTGDILTVSRAQEGTTALAFSAADLVQLRQTRASYAESLQRDGTVAMTGNLDLGTTNKIINLAAGTVATDAVNKGQVDAVQTALNDAARFRTGFLNLRGGIGTTSGNLTCDRVWLRNAAGDIVSVASGSVLNWASTTAGPAAGGRDQAGSFIAQWTYIYYIWNGTTLALIQSANASAPVLPSGYTHYAYACAIRVSATANNMVGGFIRGRTFEYPINQAVLLNGGVATTTYTLTNTGAYIPPVDCICTLGGTLAPVTGAGNVSLVEVYFSPDGVSGTYGYWIFRAVFNGSGVTQNTDKRCTVPRLAAADLRATVSLDAGTSCNAQVWVESFEMNNGAI